MFLNSKIIIWNILHPEMFSREFSFWGDGYLPWQTWTCQRRRRYSNMPSHIGQKLSEPSVWRENRCFKNKSFRKLETEKTKEKAHRHNLLASCNYKGAKEGNQLGGFLSTSSPILFQPDDLMPKRERELAGSTLAALSAHQNIEPT